MPGNPARLADNAAQASQAHERRAWSESRGPRASAAITIEWLPGAASGSYAKKSHDLYAIAKLKSTFHKPANSINCFLSMFPSLPGVEGARHLPRVLPRAASRQKRQQEQMQTALKHKPRRPLDLYDLQDSLDESKIARGLMSLSSLALSSYQDTWITSLILLILI
ncbi:MAG: hypothetical protein NTY37_11820 [Methanothrix sp.]|nr:hypothetical protein [Methanothrix sp.]